MVLGNLVDQSMKEILSSDKAKMFMNHAADNFGHCKIRAYFNGDKAESATFKKMDPLYACW